MVLTDKKIRELVKKEELIVPFNESNLQSESYDVTIGTEITELSKEIHCIDISKQETVDNITELLWCLIIDRSGDLNNLIFRAMNNSGAVRGVFFQ